MAEHRIWEEEFVKKDGTRRRMRFYRLGDMRPEDRARLGIPPPSQRPHMPLPEGSEIVWDIDARGFRVFNWRTRPS